MWFGKHSDTIHDLIALTVEEGVGTGIFVDGQLIGGPIGMAGEFGHISLNEDGPLCRCGNRGCWEVYASNTAAINYYAKTATKSRNGRGPDQTALPAFDDLLRLCESGDPKAIEAIDRMGYYMGVGISMLITGFAPSLIVVIGEVTRVWNRVGPIINRVVSQKPKWANATQITPLDWLAQPRMRGAIALVLQKHLVAPTVA
jgi:predicted NBD/HSP70 family sugar kinase